MTVGWQPWWTCIPSQPGAEWCSRWVDSLKGVVWTKPRVPAPIAIRLVLMETP